MSAIVVQVCYFASARDAAGCTSEGLELPAPATVADLRARLRAGDRPRLAGLLGACRVAVGDDFASDGAALRQGDEVFILPPVSGGSGPRRKAAVVGRDLEIGEAARSLDLRGAGGLATFTGVTRDHSRGRRILHLDFEAHVPLAEKELGRILYEATEAHGLVDARVLHRVGRVGLGEVAVDIAVSAAHRAEAFAGCRYIIDELKKRVPIWKRETDEEGSEWVTPTP